LPPLTGPTRPALFRATDDQQNALPNLPTADTGVAIAVMAALHFLPSLHPLLSADTLPAMPERDNGTAQQQMPRAALEMENGEI
jgi:hypothetical protein